MSRDKLLKIEKTPYTKDTVYGGGPIMMCGICPPVLNQCLEQHTSSPLCEVTDAEVR